MSTYALTVFICGLIFMAIMGLVCGYYTLKLLKFVEKEQAAKEKADAQANQAKQETNL